MEAVELHSAFSPYIESFLGQKRANGYTYGTEELILREFDGFVSKRFPEEVVLTREIYLSWSEQKDTEGINYRARRASVVRQLAAHMEALGVASHQPHDRFSTEAPVVHIMSPEEMAGFFAEVDKGRGYAPALMYDVEYQVLFRLLYCCGMRLSEACGLPWGDVDLGSATLTIRQSKSHKDRIVYMAGDVARLMEVYHERIREFVESEWVFPGGAAGSHILKTSVCRAFRQIWNRTDFSRSCSKRPTAHCLRHGFVVDRMNEWMLDGANLGTKTPYLSMYLGHQSMDETFYYYHQANKAYQVIRKCDASSGLVIPEVSAHG